MSTAEQAPEPEHHQPVPARGSNRRAIGVTCSTCGGATGFATLMVTKRDSSIVLDPHVAGSCVIVLDEVAATALFDLLGEWLG